MASETALVDIGSILHPKAVTATTLQHPKGVLRSWGGLLVAWGGTSHPDAAQLPPSGGKNGAKSQRSDSFSCCSPELPLPYVIWDGFEALQLAL